MEKHFSMSRISLIDFFSAGLALAALLATWPVQATTLADCRAIADDTGRLACFDRLTDEAIALVASSAKPPAENRLDNIAVTVPDSLLGRAWELDAGNRDPILRIRPYKPVYMLPLFHSSRPNRTPYSPAAGHTLDAKMPLNADEAKLQISLKTRIATDLIAGNGDLWFGYTQSSRWQVYNDGFSRPFRETNHEPELMLLWRTDYELAGWRGRFFNLALNHQSNGRSLPLSRSWNRVMLSADLERQDWTLSLRPWWRVPESAEKDDNPDIARYLGRGDLNLVRRWGSHQFSLTIRHSLRGGRDGHGAIQADYGFPIAGDLRGHLQLFSGYGESLIDYNHRANVIGLGVSLLEWY